MRISGIYLTKRQVIPAGLRASTGPDSRQDLPEHDVGTSSGTSALNSGYLAPTSAGRVSLAGALATARARVRST